MWEKKLQPAVAAVVAEMNLREVMTTVEKGRPKRHPQVPRRSHCCLLSRRWREKGIAGHRHGAI